MKTKKKKTNEGKIDTVLDKLDLFMRELREDRKSNSAKFAEMEKTINDTKAAQEEIKTEVNISERYHVGKT